MNYKIEKNVPILPMGKRVRQYPFHEMEVGDSFACEDVELVRHASNYWAKKLSMKFATRTTDTKTGAGRIWRIS